MHSVACAACASSISSCFAFLYMLLKLRRAVQKQVAAQDAVVIATNGARRRRRAAKAFFGRLATFVTQLVRRARSMSTVGKILLAYFQVLSAFLQLHRVQWPPLFGSYLETLSLFSFQV